MKTIRIGAGLRLVGAGAVLAGGLAYASTAAAQEDESGALIDADVVADIAIEGGDAQGGDAAGGDAGLSTTVNGSAGHVDVTQEAELLQGGDAQGGDAQGGDGLNAYVDADVVLDADVNLDVAADVGVSADAGVDASLPDVPLDGDGLQSAAQPVDTGGIEVPEVDLDNVGGTLGGGLTDDLSGTAGDLSGVTGGLADAASSDALSGLPANPLASLGGLAGLQLLDLSLDAEIEVRGGDAAGGDAAGGAAALQATIADVDGGWVAVDQKVEAVYGGDATGGTAVGGDGIELDVFLVADIDLVVDAAVDLAVDADVALDAGVDSGSQRAQLTRFQTLD